ncbi:MAG TPA: hypothetical protein VIY08_16250 [Candidatus Nitrosocosmicus sp.]
MKSVTWILPILLLVFVLVAIYSLESTQNTTIRLASDHVMLINKNPISKPTTISKPTISLESNISGKNITK